MGYHWDCALLAHARAHTNKSILACQAFVVQGDDASGLGTPSHAHTRKQGQIKCGSRPHQAFFVFLPCMRARLHDQGKREGIKSHIGRVRDTSHSSVAADNMQCTGSRQPSFSLSPSHRSLVCCEQSLAALLTTHVFRLFDFQTPSEARLAIPWFHQCRRLQWRDVRHDLSCSKRRLPWGAAAEKPPAPKVKA